MTGFPHLGQRVGVAAFSVWSDLVKNEFHTAKVTNQAFQVI
jgi:hypothetical protein